MSNFEHIHPSALQLAQNNARRSAAEKHLDQELKANIAANGILQNLVVGKPNDKGIYPVLAGGRRLRAVQELITEGQLDEDYRIPCRIMLHDDQAEESSLAENTCRAPMHEVDQFEAYGRLMETQGYTADKLAKHFGRPLQEVRKVLALAGVAPEIRQACRDGKIDVDDVRAFTVSTDHAQQVKVFNALSKTRSLYAHIVRATLTNDAVDSRAPLARFVGLAAYTKAGGKIAEDLFRTETLLLDTKLLNRLADEKLQKAKDGLGEGWAFIEVDQDFREWEIGSTWKQKRGNYDKAPAELFSQIENIKKQKELAEDHAQKLVVAKELKNAEKLLRKYQDFSEADKAASGCIITINDGKLQVFKGLYKSAGKAKKKTEDSSDDPVADTPESGFSQAVKDELVTAKHLVAKLALMQNVALGYDLLTFSLVIQCLSDDRYDLPISVNVKDTAADAVWREEIDGSPRFIQACKDITEANKWFDADGDMLANFAAYRALPADQKNQLLAAVAGMALASDNWHHSYGIEDLILTESNTNIADYWRPTAENFFSRIKKSACLEYGAEIFNDPTWPEANKGKSRGELANMLSGKIAGIEEGAPCWLPPFGQEDSQ